MTLSHSRIYQLFLKKQVKISEENKKWREGKKEAILDAIFRLFKKIFHLIEDYKNLDEK